MALLTKRAPPRETESPPPPAHVDYDISSIKRRWLRIKALGIRAVGPSGPPEPPALPEARMRDSAEHVEHQATVARELYALDKYARQLDARLERMRGTGAQDRAGLESERVKLKLLRAEVERDLIGWPAATTPEQRQYVEVRARQLREQLWASAERHARAGDHRHATSCRIDSLRSRQVAEHEIGLRQNLSGY